MILNVNYIVYTIACAAVITGIIIGVVRQRRAMIKDENLATLIVWIGLSLSHAIIDVVFKYFGWKISIVTFIFGVLSFVFIGYLVGRISYFLFHAYNKNKNR